MLLAAQGISKRYGVSTVLRDAAFSVRDGEVLGLIGPNGSGKTTLFEALAGLIPVNGGEVLFRGQPLPPAHRKQALFYLPDAIRPWPGQTVAWILGFFAVLHGRPRSDCPAIARSLDLTALLPARAGSLSKGESKRLLLALALLTPHPLLLLDEPFDGLDFRQARDVMVLLRTVPASGRTVFLSIHQLADAARACDRFVLLSRGRVAGEGTLPELRAQAGLAEATLEEVFLALTEALPLLTGKELRELFVSRAFWLLLVIIGPLVGHGFITAVDSYAEASGIAGGPAALAQGLSPLDGILVPTFGAYDLAVTLLFPFVAIRLVAAEKAGGAWKLMEQAPVGLASMLLAKALALLAAWALAWTPGLAALAFWKAYGGTLYLPETANLLLGHLLRVVLASGVAVAAAAIADGAASAAIATLAFTVGTWALDFVAAGRGGLLQRLASYTPAAALRVFEQGQFRLATLLVTLLLGLAGFAIAAVWLPSRRTLRARLALSAAVALALAPLLWAASLPRASRDLSENRRNSFPRADEAALRQIRAPLRVTVNLAPEDPRLTDLDRNVLSKLARVLPRLQVDRVSRTRAGLFETPGEHYGEVWYELAGRRAMSRSATEPIVLDTLYQLAGIAPPARAEGPEYPGHPLAAQPKGAALFYYAVWPLAAGLACWLHFRDRRPA